MSNADNHNDSWSDTDIQKYLKGELSAREMHQLEKAALEDPFLSDALEGLAMPHSDGDLGDLRSRLDARVEEKEKGLPVLWFRRPAFRVAAAVILLAGIGLTAYYTLLKGKERGENSSLAKATATTGTTSAEKTTAAPSAQPLPPSATATPPATAPHLPPATADSTKLSNGAAAALDATIPASADHRPAANTLRAKHKHKVVEARDADLTKAEVSIPAEAKAAPPAEAKVAAPETATAGLRTEAPTLPGTKVSKDTVLQNKSLARKMQSSFSENYSFRAKPSSLFFSGRVVDANDKPLAGASLFLKGYSNFKTITDNQGQFSFQLPRQDTTRQMTVALVGYQQASFSLNTSSQINNIIRLQEAKTSLDEVVVTGFGKQRRETLASVPSDSKEQLDSIWLKVVPVNGKPSYIQYLAAAKKTLVVDSTIRGIERISFQVDQKGQITDYKIEQSLSPAHDAGLIQLISTGPAWKLLHGKKARAVVSLSFP
jgi:hypothetical protein